jgi:7-cyano-7-deazaguanine reductase
LNETYKNLCLRASASIAAKRYNPAILTEAEPYNKMNSQPSKNLESFPNPRPGRDYHIHMEIPEFTCLCPKTGQPDFATLVLESLKLYIWSFRDEGHFHEDVTNRILDDLVAALQPRYMRLTAKFNVRGGIFTNVVAENRKPGWQPAQLVDLTRFEGQSNTRS